MRSFHVVVAGLAALSVGAAALGGYVLSPPATENLPLPPDLISLPSEEGQQLLHLAEAKADYAQLAPHFVAQSRRAFCGPATITGLINAALIPHPPATQTSIFNAATDKIKGEFALSFTGLTLSELAGFLRAHGFRVQVVHAGETTLASFRSAAGTALMEPRSFVVVNYDRRVLLQSGAGHISPLGAFHSGTDRVLVLDVASQKYPFSWIPTERLWSAMNTLDSASGQTRGYLLVTVGAGASREPPSR